MNKEMKKIKIEKFIEDEMEEIEDLNTDILNEWELMEFDEYGNKLFAYLIEHREYSIMEMRFYYIDNKEEKIVMYKMMFDSYDIEDMFNSFEEFTDYCFEEFETEFETIRNIPFSEIL